MCQLLPQMIFAHDRSHHNMFLMSKTKKNTSTARPKGIGRSAITGRFMSVPAAKAHKKTAIIEGSGRKKGR